MSKVEVKKFRIKIDIYHTSVEVIFTNNIKETISTMFEDISKNDAKSYAAGWFRRETKTGSQKDIIIFDTTNFSINSMVHEVGHAVGSILNYRGIIYDSENDEPYTYLQGYLAGKIYKKALIVGCRIKAE